MGHKQRKLATQCTDITFAAPTTTALLNKREEDGIQWKKSQIHYLNNDENNRLHSMTHLPSSADSLIKMF